MRCDQGESQAATVLPGHRRGAAPVGKGSQRQRDAGLGTDAPGRGLLRGPGSPAPASRLTGRPKSGAWAPRTRPHEATEEAPLVLPGRGGAGVRPSQALAWRAALQGVRPGCEAGREPVRGPHPPPPNTTPRRLLGNLPRASQTRAAPPRPGPRSPHLLLEEA